MQDIENDDEYHTNKAIESIISHAQIYVCDDCLKNFNAKRLLPKHRVVLLYITTIHSAIKSLDDYIQREFINER